MDWTKLASTAIKAALEKKKDDLIKKGLAKLILKVPFLGLKVFSGPIAFLVEFAIDLFWDDFMLEIDFVQIDVSVSMEVKRWQNVIDRLKEQTQLGSVDHETIEDARNALRDLIRFN